MSVTTFYGLGRQDYLSHDLANLLNRGIIILEPVNCFYGPKVVLLIWKFHTIIDL